MILYAGEGFSFRTFRIFRPLPATYQPRYAPQNPEGPKGETFSVEHTSVRNKIKTKIKSSFHLQVPFLLSLTSLKFAFVVVILLSNAPHEHPHGRRLIQIFLPKT